MKSSLCVFLVLFCIFTQQGWSQAGATAVPFLLISPSTEANGMGGIMTSVTPTNSSTMVFNPAQLGMLSRTHSFSSDFYTNVVQWLPAFNLSDLWLNNYSMMYGVNLGDAFPDNVSIGIGYSRTYLNLGEFVRTSGTDPAAIEQFHGHESSNNYSIGFSFDVGAIIALGTTLKSINSSLVPFGTAQEAGSEDANLTAVDLGVISKIPIDKLLWNNANELPHSITPTLDFTCSYAMDNLGGSVKYGGSTQEDPLPRIVRIGWSVESGLQVNLKGTSFNFVQLTIAREAENILATRNADGTIGRYKGPFGDININTALIESRQHGYVDVRRGFSAQLLETFTYRQGSFDGIGNLVYNTTGMTISTRGFSRLMGSIVENDHGFSLTKYFLSHFEIRVSSSEYSHHDILENTKFNNIVFSFYQ
jgi:hypothetical protein